MKATTDRDRSFSALSLTAWSVDVLVVFLCLVAFSDAAFVKSFFQRQGISHTLFPLLALPLGLLVHYAIVEVALSGHSIGRLCTGLNYVSAGTRQTAPMASRLQRYLAMVARCGLGTLSLAGRPACDRRQQSLLTSDWLGPIDTVATPAGRAPTPPRGGSSPAQSGRRNGAQLEVVAGPDTGLIVPLATAIRKDGSGVFVIGRDANQAHLVLASDAAVSRVHCRIAARAGRHFIVDGASKTKPSSHGTRLNGIAVPSTSATALIDGAIIKLGTSQIVFRQ